MSFDAALTRHHTAALLIGRVLIGSIFVIEAFIKMKNYNASLGYFTALGLFAPAVALPLTILFEAAVGILLIVGYQTRLAALAVAAFCIATAFVAHANFGDGNQLNHFLKNIAIAGGCLAVMVAGAGSASLDARNK